MPALSAATETLDALSDGGLQLVQSRDGYRFNLDSVLLAGFAASGSDAARALNVVDLGTGCGVIGLLLARWRPSWRVRGVEVQPGLASLARRNAELNGLALPVDEGDWRAVAGPPQPLDGADLVVCNPPYFPTRDGLVSPDPEKAAARHELHGTLGEAVGAGRRLAGARGAVQFVVATARARDLFAAFAHEKLVLTRLRFVHARAGDEAYAVLAEGRAGARAPLAVAPPLVVHGDAERFTPEVARLLSREGV